MGIISLHFFFSLQTREDPSANRDADLDHHRDCSCYATLAAGESGSIEKPTDLHEQQPRSVDLPLYWFSSLILMLQLQCPCAYHVHMLLGPRHRRDQHTHRANGYLGHQDHITMPNVPSAAQIDMAFAVPGLSRWKSPSARRLCVPNCCIFSPPSL